MKSKSKVRVMCPNMKCWYVNTFHPACRGIDLAPDIKCVSTFEGFRVIENTNVRQLFLMMPASLLKHGPGSLVR